MLEERKWKEGRVGGKKEEKRDQLSKYDKMMDIIKSGGWVWWVGFIILFFSTFINI